MCIRDSLATTAMMESTGADIAILNSGSILSSVPQGDITFGAMYNALDFDDYIYVLKSFVDYMIEQYEGNREQKTINVGQNIRHKRLGCLLYTSRCV